MKPSSLQLNHCTVDAVSLRACEAGQIGHQVNVTTNTNYSRSQTDPAQWLINLEVIIKTPADQPPAPYEGQIAVTGIFTVLGSLAEEQLLKLIAVSGPSILYGTARETFAMLSARGKNGVLLIPSVSFADQVILGENKTKAPVEVTS